MIAREQRRVRELGSQHVENRGERHQHQKHQMPRRVGQLHYRHDPERVEEPVTQKDDQVTLVLEAAQDQGFDRLVQLEGEVRGGADDGEDEDDEGVGHVHQAAGYRVGHG